MSNTVSQVIVRPMAKELVSFREDPAHRARASAIAAALGKPPSTVVREGFRRGLAQLEAEHAAGGPLPPVLDDDAEDVEPEPCTCGEIDATLGEAGRALRAIPAIARRLPLGPLASTAYSKLCSARADLETAIAVFDSADRRDALRANDVVVVRVHGAPFRLPGSWRAGVPRVETVASNNPRQPVLSEGLELLVPSSAVHRPGRELEVGDHRLPTRDWLALDDEPAIRQALADGRLEVVEIAKTVAPKAARVATAEDVRRKLEHIERRDRDLRKQGRCIDPETGEECELVSAHDPEANEWRDVPPSEARRMREETDR